MAIQYIYKICPACHGTGVSETERPPGDPEVGECVTCAGVKKVLWGYLQDELEGEE